MDVAGRGQSRVSSVVTTDSDCPHADGEIEVSGISVDRICFANVWSTRCLTSNDCSESAHFPLPMQAIVQLGNVGNASNPRGP